MFEYHIKEIENPDFQIQFIALSGFSVLELILSTHANIKSLLADLAAGQVKNQEVYERVLHLLPLVADEKKCSYDGSIVVYLYCLVERDPSLAYEASSCILNTGGLFWSRQLARTFTTAYQEQQISVSIEFSSEIGEPFTYALTGEEYPSFQQMAQYSHYLVALEAPVKVRGLMHQHALSDQVKVQNVSFGSLIGRAICQKNIYTTKEFAIANVI
jgi:hypothetical protein